MSKKAIRIATLFQSIGFGVLLSLAGTVGTCFGQPSAPSTHAAASTASTVIPSAEVAAKASEVANLLTSLSETYAPSSDIEKIRQSLPTISRQIDIDIADTYAIIGGHSPLATLQASQALWQRRHQQISTAIARLTKQATELRKGLSSLKSLHEEWTQTLDAAQAEPATEVILKQIQATLVSIEAAEAPLKTQEEALLGLQGHMAGELARCDEMIEKIAKTQKEAVQGILTRESPAVWDLGLWRRARAVLPSQLGDIFRGFYLNIAEYLRDPSRGMPLHAAIFAVLAVAAGAARLKKRQWTASGIGVSAAVKVFERPYSAALVVALLAATTVISPTPARVKDLFSAMALIPIMRLVGSAIDPRLAPGVVAAVIFYVFDLVRQSLGGAPMIGQVLLMLESLAAIAILRWLLSDERLRLAVGQPPESMPARSVRVLAILLILGLSIAFIAAAIGYTTLARLITPVAFSGSVLALWLYALVRVLSGTVAVALREWPLKRLQMVVNHCDRIERWIFRVMKWWAMLMWTVRLLDYIGLLSPVAAIGSAILNTKFERGAISFSIEDILTFGLTVWASYLLSAFIRFVLREEVYPRAGIPSGTAYASSRLLHYTILSLGFLIGLGLLGIDLSKVTVLAGAFGVGIGFGLQSVVNNFVCGLILLFERPIHVGDMIEVGGLPGEVRRIGFRASTVRTRQGADIIIPNAQFITANVTNWTYSDRLRRIDVPVGVNYASSPKHVIAVLENVARANPQVLQVPAPHCLFTGYGDSSINFELRVWTEQYADYARIRSELNSAIYEAVSAAGMAFPFPQREVRLLSDAKTVSSETSKPKKDTEEPSEI